MKKLLQITGSIFFASLLPVVCLVILMNGANNSAARPDSDTSEATDPGVKAYSKMALLSLKEPDRKLAMPVKGVKIKQIANTWGAARAGGREHTGQDIFARRGTPVFSATEGYVLRIGENTLGGKVIFIYGAGGRRYYYAHLEGFAPDLKAGDFVTTDTLLGYVGTTGNAAGTPPHLHFAVYAEGGAINPLPLLSDRM